MSRLRESLEKNYHWLSTAAILSGFILDSLTLVRVDLFLTNLLLGIYLFISGAGIVVINLYEDKRAATLSGEAYQWLFVAMQFSFGGLFGRFLIYYSRSGSFFASWPFLLLLAGLLIGNEFSRKYYSRLVLQMSFFFLALFTYLIFLVPILLGRIGDDIFLLSGGISLLLIALFIRLLSRIVPNRVNDKSRAVFLSIVVIFITMNILYFTNIIPPIPLALRQAGAYHSVAPSSGGYIVLDEAENSLAAFLPYKTIRLIPGEAVSVYSAVFAPTNFDTSIIHNWQFYDETNKKWRSRSRITLPIVGGRESGYRGYSIKTNLTPGFWRVVIETLRGQAVGQVEFQIEYVGKEPPLFRQTL